MADAAATARKNRWQGHFTGREFRCSSYLGKGSRLIAGREPNVTIRAPQGFATHLSPFQSPRSRLFLVRLNFYLRAIRGHDKRGAAGWHLADLAGDTDILAFIGVDDLLHSRVTRF